jgi:hypothetical protein
MSGRIRTKKAYATQALYSAVRRMTSAYLSGVIMRKYANPVGGGSFRGAVRSDDSALTSHPGKGNKMSKIDELKADIERLPEEDVAELFRWLSEKEWENWDKEIEADSQAGKRDFLVREAHEEKAKGTLKEM